MKDNRAIMEKIKKLLALGKSPNANEAAAAIKRARDLMEQHGITDEEISLSDIREEPIKRKGDSKPPRYEAALMSTIAQAFGLRVIYAGSEWLLAGAGFRLEVGQYVTAILLRKLNAARAEYTKTLHRCKRSTKTKRADAYCLGWVAIIVDKVRSFAGAPIPQAEKDLLDRYMSRYEDMRKDSVIDRANYKGNLRDIGRGADAARDVDLRRGVKDADPDHCNSESLLNYAPFERPGLAAFTITA